MIPILELHKYLSSSRIQYGAPWLILSSIVWILGLHRKSNYAPPKLWGYIITFFSRLAVHTTKETEKQLYFAKNITTTFHFLTLFLTCTCIGIQRLFYSGWTPLISSFITQVRLIARFMGPTWGPSGADRTQVGPMLASWTLLSRKGLRGHAERKRCRVSISSNCVWHLVQMDSNAQIWWYLCPICLQNKEWNVRWIETPRRSYEITVMQIVLKKRFPINQGTLMIITESNNQQLDISKSI